MARCAAPARAARATGGPPDENVDVRFEADGRLSLAHFRGRFWLFARANYGAHGQRAVQAVARTALRFCLIRRRHRKE